MIKVVKSATPPKILIEKGLPGAEALKKRYDDDSQPIQDTAAPVKIAFAFDDGIYGAPEVRSQLYLDQHSKCCYCERYLVKPIHVEHWWPKAAIQPGRGIAPLHSGYYWLAYDWRHLFAACFSCNNSKGILFPIRAGATYPKSHHDNLNDIQDVLLVHPTEDEPDQHITFAEEIVKPVNGSEKGKNTITICGLDSDETETLRKMHLREYRQAVALVSLADMNHVGSAAALLHSLNLYDLQEVSDLIQEALELLKTAHDRSPFAGMIRANFPDRNLHEAAIQRTSVKIQHTGTGDIVMGDKIGKQINMGDHSTYNETNNG